MGEHMPGQAGPAFTYHQLAHVVEVLSSACEPLQACPNMLPDAPECVVSDAMYALSRTSTQHELCTELSIHSGLA